MVTPELKWPIDELDAVADEFVGDRHALLGIGDVVALFERNLLAEDAAGLVDVLDRLRACRCTSCAPKAAFGPVIGPVDAHLDLGAGGARERQGRDKRDARQPMFNHSATPMSCGRLALPGARRQKAIPPWARILSLFWSRVTLKSTKV